ncbi:MAG: hypothetical protein WDN75_17430 [Bacteroidota bacterium]
METIGSKIPGINRRSIVLGVVSVIGFILFLIVNPFSWNDAGNRTVVERTTGQQIVQFAPGIFYAGFFAKEKEWPNQISVTYQSKLPTLSSKTMALKLARS